MSVDEKLMTKKQLIRNSLIMLPFGLFIFFVGGSYAGLGTLIICTVILFWLYKYVLSSLSRKFQTSLLVKFENWYERRLRFALRGRNAYFYFGGTVLLLIVSFMLFGASLGSGRTKVDFFPDNKPNQIIVYIEYPEGTAIEKTNQITKDIESRVYEVLNAPKYMDQGYNFMTESAVSQVGEGAGNPQTDGGSNAEMPHRGKITASMREYKYRRGLDSEKLRLEVQKALKGIYPGVSISVEKEAVGPPVGYPVNIEVSGRDYNQLIQEAEKLRNFINSTNVNGIDELKIDVNRDKPSMKVAIDRKKSGELGVSAAQIGQQLRNSIFGTKAGVYKKEGEDYDIYVRFNQENRYNSEALFNQKITFRDQASGTIKEVPLNTLVEHRNTSSFSAIKHIDLKRVVTVYSGVVPGANANEIVQQLKKELKDFKMPPEVSYKFTGEIEEQGKQMSFLLGALASGLGLIMLLLVFQFNSISYPSIIMIAIFLSFIGVFFGLIITGWNFVIMMTMMGIISLAGIVVNNGVVLLDYILILMNRKKEALGISKEQLLSREDILEAIVAGGKSRLRPVLLTAITTVLGLLPLATGLNIDFFSLFTELDPKIYFGGDNVIFWGPLAWTVIFGLTFATFLTLIVVPVMNYLVLRLKLKIKRK